MRNDMMNTNMMEEIDGGNFFDQFDDLLEFPVDGVDSAIFDSAAVDCTAFPPVWSEDSPDFSAGHSNSASDLSAELSVPYEDIVQLEWLSTFVEDSFSSVGLTLEKPQTTSSDNKDSFQNQFQTSSPISVLESSSSTCSRGKTLPVSHEKRARSKRPRPATFTPRAPIQLISPFPAPVTSSESGNFAESYAFYKGVDKQKKKRKIKILPPSGSGSSDVTTQTQNQTPNDGPGPGPVRKCKHCEITKTPQWRAGPMGPKSLCNACGVRYKSGRLYPEYRPAASPTFVPSLHSNSHKKVLEMRGCVTVEPEKSGPPPPSRKLEVIPKTDLVGPYM
ncbi:hypothetical protein RND81_02G224000 [Saponaria officinalis]|uniref:GATA transcription factor n=1 Tax=Saponaria officinalis TaxID=3572 RepID=A0AAW1MZL7_SAPOF